MVIEVNGKSDVSVTPFLGDDDEFNIKIKVRKGFTQPEIYLDINKNRLFRTLENRLEVVGAINKKLNELVQNHLDTLAFQQEQAERDK